MRDLAFGVLGGSITYRAVAGVFNAPLFVLGVATIAASVGVIIVHYRRSI